uniref:Uncharacterized protein n=1 Tax=Solanum tuberosum TaxID=4113 RepID=M1D638_SOLTU
MTKSKHLLNAASSWSFKVFSKPVQCESYKCLIKCPFELLATIRSTSKVQLEP